MSFFAENDDEEAAGIERKEEIVPLQETLMLTFGDQGYVCMYVFVHMYVHMYACCSAIIDSQEFHAVL
jgi:hypothetical protein